MRSFEDLVKEMDSLCLERNQQAEDEEERNTTILRVLKDRNTGLATGTIFKLRYDHTTGRCGELDEDEFNEEF